MANPAARTEVGGGIHHRIVIESGRNLTDELRRSRLRGFRNFPPLRQVDVETSLFQKFHIEFRRGQAVFQGFAFVGQQIRGIQKQDHVHTIGGNAPLMVKVRHSLHNRIGQPPETEEVRAHFSMGNVDQAFLNLIQGSFFLAGLLQGAREMAGVRSAITSLPTS